MKRYTEEKKLIEFDENNFFYKIRKHFRNVYYKIRKLFYENKEKTNINIQMKKRVEDSQTEQTYLMRPIYLNEYGNLFGGQLMEWIDEIASIVAMRHSEADITTACIDNLNFKEGATVNDVIVLRGKITYVGRTSMEVRVDTYVESRQGIRKVINRAYVVMVAVDEHHHPIPVPGLIVESESEKAEWEGGEKRYALRKERRKEGY